MKDSFNITYKDGFKPKFIPHKGGKSLRNTEQLTILH